MKISPTNRRTKVLILGIGNVLMGDEGVGVHVVNALEKAALPQGAECLDGGTGSFLLLEPMQNAEKVILIDATIDGSPAGTIRRLRPKFSADYPPTLTAHDIGLKDLLDAFYLTGMEAPEVSLYAVSVRDLNAMQTELSPELEAIVKSAARLVTDEAWRLTEDLQTGCASLHGGDGFASPMMVYKNTSGRLPPVLSPAKAG